ncbi:MAG: hypothetical protein WAT92_16750 [Saprospiraceae bacterium]
MKENVNQRSVIWALIFAIIFPISVFVLSKYTLPLAMSLLIILVNAIVFGVYTKMLIKSISHMDEVQIRIQFEAVSIAFVLSMLMILVLGLVGIDKNMEIGNISYLYIFPFFFLFYVIGWFITKRKYL